MSSKIILCDIEGTTTSISFVKENLFPYAAKNVDSFLNAKWDAADTQEAVKMLRDQSVADKKDDVQGCVEIAAETEDKAKQIETIAANVKWQMDHDRKAGPLKNLQGLMWVEAYKAGEFKGQVYDDVAPAFEAWTKAGRKIYIYSSGSAAIQKVHFEFSAAGDLAKYLSGYFDTKVGAKQDKASYEAIWKEVSKEDATLNTKDVLFLTDIPAEAKAAKEAGMEAILLKRPGNTELTAEEATTYKVVESLADVVIPTEEEAAPKRKIEDAPQDDEVNPAKVPKIDDSAAVDGKEKTDPAPESSVKDEATPVAEKMDSESKKTEDETKGSEEDVPMMEQEEATKKSSTEAAEKTDVADNDDKKVSEGEAKEPAQEEKKTEQPQAAAKEEEKMEVDSTTAAVTTPPEAVTTTTTDAAEATEVKATSEVDKEATASTTTTKSETDPPKESTEAVTPVTDTKATTNGVAAAKESVEAATEEKKKEAEKKPESEEAISKAVEAKEKDSEVTASSTEVPEAKEEEKKSDAEAEKATVNGGSNAESVKATNGTTSESAEASPQKNGTEAVDAVSTNGHQDHDSDKENDKSMEAKSEEVSTTSGVAADDADVVVAKKCAAMDAVTEPPAAATPVPAEVEAES